MWNLNHIWQLWNTLRHMHPCSVNWRNFKRFSASRTILTDWTAANTLHIYMDRCWVITKCLSETERCAKIQNSIPSQQHNSKGSKGLTIITFHIFSYEHNSLRKCVLRYVSFTSAYFHRCYSNACFDKFSSFMNIW